MTTSPKGMIVLMGSGELTATMVEVHKELLNRVSKPPKAVFMDTPAGFQLNVDLISQRAREYFKTHIRQALAVASLTYRETSSELDTQRAYRTLREADYVLIGPGSPTYAVRHLVKTPVPEILINRIETGGCLVAASAAALTVGRFTLPVYEIYKVGSDLHWVGGMNILGHFGFNLVVVPHWNNAEGGNHDTRFCFMGATRFKKLVSLLPEAVTVVGLDEHTACIMDFEHNEAEVKGIGRVVLQHGDTDLSFEKGDRFPLDLFRQDGGGRNWRRKGSVPATEAPPSETVTDSFWKRVHGLEEMFRQGLAKRDSKATTQALLELDRTIWQAHKDLEDEETISEAREILRDLIVLIGTARNDAPDRTEDLAVLVEAMLDLRETFRRSRHWAAADAIRTGLQRADIIIEDTQDGARWRRVS